jgi:hypothetical protein
MHIRKLAFLLTGVFMVAAIPIGFILGLLLFGPRLPERSPEERLAWDSTDCQGLAGIRHTTPEIYAYTKAFPYNLLRYQECMRQRGYRTVPPLP